MPPQKKKTAAPRSEQPKQVQKTSKRRPAAGLQVHYAEMEISEPGRARIAVSATVPLSTAVTILAALSGEGAGSKYPKWPA